MESPELKYWYGETLKRKLEGERPQGIESTAPPSVSGSRPSKSSMGLMLSEEAYGNDCPHGQCEV